VIPLTRRQRDVVHGIMRGETYEEIADRLGIAERTVRMHVDAIARDIDGKGTPRRRVRRYFANLTLSDVA
jgi:DNA-binding CsgD family transcriptional regulator